MTSKVLAFYWITLLGLIHELTHLITAILFYPFGTRVIGGGIVINRVGLGGWERMYIKTVHRYPVIQVIVALAPALWYCTFFCWLAWNECYLLYIVLMPTTAKYFRLSSDDLVRVRGGVRKMQQNK